jgi:hypothetical protein
VKKQQQQKQQPSSRRQQPSRSQSQQQQQPRRSFLVLSSLVAVLTLTSVLLRAMQGAPLTPDAASSSSLIGGAGAGAGLAVIFNTAVPAHPSHWKSIYIHHTRTAAGNAASLAVGDQGCGDHFVIGNGDGAGDGQIQFTQRWNLQQAADPAPGYTQVEPSCVSISLVGDFDRTAPTPTQLKRLEQLVHTLQEHFRIPSSQVWVFEQPASPAGVGRYFPAAAFQGQLLR